MLPWRADPLFCSARTNCSAARGPIVLQRVDQLLLILAESYPAVRGTTPRIIRSSNTRPSGRIVY